MEAWKILDACHNVLWVSVLHHGLVEAQDLLFVLEVKVEGAQLVRDFADYLCHSLNDFIVIVGDDERLEKIRDELLLNLLELKVLKDLQHGLYHFDTYVALFIVE